MLKRISLGAFCILLALSLLFGGTGLVMAQGLQVTVDAPEKVTGSFDTSIGVEGITNLDSGQFDLSYDADVLEVTEVKDGNIGGIAIPIEQWVAVDEDTIRVLFNIPGVDGASGSGALAVVSFRVTGDIDDTSALSISECLLGDTTAKAMPATLSGTSVVVTGSGLGAGAIVGICIAAIVVIAVPIWLIRGRKKV